VVWFVERKWRRRKKRKRSEVFIVTSGLVSGADTGEISASLSSSRRDSAVNGKLVVGEQ